MLGVCVYVYIRVVCFMAGVARLCLALQLCCRSIGICMGTMQTSTMRTSVELHIHGVFTAPVLQEAV